MEKTHAPIKSPPKRKPELRVYLGKSIQQRWLNYCQKNQLSPTRYLKQIIEDVVSKQPINDTTMACKINHDKPDAGQKIRVEIRLTPSEYDLIQTHHLTVDSTIQQWIIALIRSYVTQQPAFSLEEAKALWRSSYELNAIGRNLNQLIKASRVDQNFAAPIDYPMIESLVQTIQSHTQSVSQLIAANRDRWQLVSPNTTK